MKVLAMYLPQFHRVKENDEWWGEGFTEWIAVKSAEKLFIDHEQPRAPFNQNYYDLTDRECMQWQTDLMHKYEIDGMCFYHYYFKNGRKILEKPAENLLKWQEVDMPFCFSWANESWVRSWSNLAKSNPWFAKFDEQTASGDGDNGVLLEQDYGDEYDWEKHYRYLSSFFHDERYIKQDGMPVFMIYKPQNIPCLNPMLKLWDKLAQEEGFPGIYTIGTNISEIKQGCLKGINLQEPQDTIAKFYPRKLDKDYDVMRLVDYHDVWESLLNKQTPQGVSLGGFVGYDDTPRRGRDGCVIHRRSPYIFYEGVKKLLIKAERMQSPFVFINAWNEWGEGMYLEPDDRYGFDFLEAFRQAKHDYHCVSEKKEFKNDNTEVSLMRMEINSLEKKVDKYCGYWQVFDAWMKLLEHGGSPFDYMKVHGYNSVAIYGYGMLGKHLVHQLKAKGYSVDYAIEKNKTNKFKEIKVYAIDDPLPKVDLIVITVLYEYDKIYDDLNKKINCDIVPIDRLFIFG